MAELSALTRQTARPRMRPLATTCSAACPTTSPRSRRSTRRARASSRATGSTVRPLLSLRLIGSGGAKVRPDEAELKRWGPGFERTGQKYFAKQINRPVVFVGVVSSFLGDQSV